mmetsp:Transcript_35649/g.74176  ORF Transcript_35649/g.74176 Transcript_35649/m.74176 type:complete len:118 (-) Transcript_35649:937-1290(-)
MILMVLAGFICEFVRASPIHLICLLDIEMDKLSLHAGTKKAYFLSFLSGLEMAFEGKKIKLGCWRLKTLDALGAKMCGSHDEIVLIAEEDWNKSIHKGSHSGPICSFKTFMVLGMLW